MKFDFETDAKNQKVSELNSKVFEVKKVFIFLGYNDFPPMIWISSIFSDIGRSKQNRTHIRSQISWIVLVQIWWFKTMKTFDDW